MAKLKTRNVFLDTQVFFDSGFRYQEPVFSALASGVTKNEVRLFLTDITVEEVKVHIREAVQESVQAHQSFAAKSKILQNSSSADVKTALAKLNQSALTDELIAQFESFLAKTKATILKTDLKAGPVLKAYFTRKPPFGPGKKKNEFPDAFAIAALHDWCSSESSELYVVSGDPDMQAACNDDGPLYSLPRLADFLDALASEEDITAFVRARIIEHKGDIIERVPKDFPDRGFIITDVADFHSSVDEVRVTGVELEDDDFEVVWVSSGKATVVANIHIHWEADLVYGDEDTAPWDGEEGRYFFINTISDTVQRDDDFDVIATVLFNDYDPGSFKVEKVELDAPDTIWISARG